jgi:hypothetical protein
MATDDDWALYAHHRARFTDAILSSAERPASGRAGRLCVLGAGRCNDVDLERLGQVFSEIHLVDIDPAALGAAVARQAPGVRERLRPHALVDLSGLSKRLAKWKRRPPTADQVEASAASTLRSLWARLPGPFDVVVSACVLTQMSFAVRDELGDGHPSLELVRFSVLATHVNALVGLTAVGGTILFATDLVSSNLYPVGDLPPSRSLRDVMDEIVASGTAYHSANPHRVREILAEENLATLVDDPELLDPWLWTGRMGRTYFVYALRIRRRA